MSTSTNEATTIDCKRCQKATPPAQGVTWGGALGDEIRAKTCNECWAEWMDAEVMVINELRLNFMDPEAQKTLTSHLREFLHLDGESDGEKSLGEKLIEDAPTGGNVAS